MKMRVTSSTHSGLGEWLLQRLSAVYLALFALFLVTRLSLWPMESQTDWIRWFGQPWVRVLWLLAFGSLLLHAWIGVRSILLDYVKSFVLRFIVTVAFATGLLACALWVIDILYGRGN